MVKSDSKCQLSRQNSTDLKRRASSSKTDLLDLEDDETRFIEEMRSKYSFPINSKVGFYEMFPHLNEMDDWRQARAQSQQSEAPCKQETTISRSMEDKTNSKETLDEVTDEQQTLFKDF